MVPKSNTKIISHLPIVLFQSGPVSKRPNSALIYVRYGLFDDQDRPSGYLHKRFLSPAYLLDRTLSAFLIRARFMLFLGGNDPTLTHRSRHAKVADKGPQLLAGLHDSEALVFHMGREQKAAMGRRDSSL
jgi:hypothetical protein